MKIHAINALGIFTLALVTMVTGCERKEATPGSTPPPAEPAKAVASPHASPTPVVALPTPAASPARGPSLTLTEDGKPAASIVIASQAPTQSAQFAALELQDQIRRITGATLPIVTDKEQVSGVRILVGESQATRDLGLKSADFKPQ
jgi:hypothetical protein